MPLIEEIVAQAGEMAALRRDIHAHPELSFEEVRTADLIAARLTEWGIAVHRGLGKTGVVGIVHGRDAGACGRALGLRPRAGPARRHGRAADARRQRLRACQPARGPHAWLRP